MLKEKTYLYLKTKGYRNYKDEILGYSLYYKDDNFKSLYSEEKIVLQSLYKEICGKEVISFDGNNREKKHLKARSKVLKLNIDWELVTFSDLKEAMKLIRAFYPELKLFPKSFQEAFESSYLPDLTDIKTSPKTEDENNLVNLARIDCLKEHFSKKLTVEVSSSSNFHSTVYHIKQIHDTLEVYMKSLDAEDENILFMGKCYKLEGNLRKMKASLFLEKYSKETGEIAYAFSPDPRNYDFLPLVDSSGINLDNFSFTINIILENSLREIFS